MTQKTQMPRQPMTQEQIDASWGDLGPAHEGGTSDLPASTAEEAAVRMAADATPPDDNSDVMLTPLGTQVVVRSITITAKLSGGNCEGGFKAVEMMTTADLGEHVNTTTARKDLYIDLERDIHLAFNRMPYPAGTAHIDAGKHSAPQAKSNGSDAPPGDLGRCEQHNAAYVQSANMHWPAHIVKDGDGNNVKKEDGKNSWCDKPGRPRRSS